MMLWPFHYWREVARGPGYADEVIVIERCARTGLERASNHWSCGSNRRDPIWARAELARTPETVWAMPEWMAKAGQKP